MTYLTIIQVLSAVLLIGAILLQQRGVGLSGVFGGSGDVYRTKRGAEKTLFNLTILLSFLFFGSALLGVILG
jgi:preprotein translocase subunit SecG